MLVAGMACWQSAGLVIERLPVPVLAGVAEEISSPELKLSVMILIRCLFHHMLLQWHLEDFSRSSKSAGGRLHLKHTYTFDPLKSEWADHAVQAYVRENLSGTMSSHSTLSGNTW